MKRMTLTMAFLISMLIMLWFFGVTMFHFGPQALIGSDSYLANVFMQGKFEAKINEEVVDGADSVYKGEAVRQCAQTIANHKAEAVTCYWRGKELQKVGLLGN